MVSSSMGIRCLIDLATDTKMMVLFLLTFLNFKYIDNASHIIVTYG